MSLLERATEKDGELIIKENNTELSVSKLLAPGVRRTDNEELLLHEARQVENGKTVGNPAKPANSKVAKIAIERIENDGLVPAWRVCEPEDYPR